MINLKKFCSEDQKDKKETIEVASIANDRQIVKSRFVYAHYSFHNELFYISKVDRENNIAVAILVDEFREGKIKVFYFDAADDYFFHIKFNDNTVLSKLHNTGYQLLSGLKSPISTVNFRHTNWKDISQKERKNIRRHTRTH